MKTGNDRMERIEKQSAHSILPLPHTLSFVSTSPIRMVIQLAHNQSENTMAQTADSQPSQTSHVELEQTTSEHTKQICSQPRPSLMFPCKECGSNTELRLTHAQTQIAHVKDVHKILGHADIRYIKYVYKLIFL